MNNINYLNNLFVYAPTWQVNSVRYHCSSFFFFFCGCHRSEYLGGVSKEEEKLTLQ